MTFKDKVVVLTGGAQGLGRCCAECFAREGATVHVIDIKEGPWFVGDLSDKATLERFAADVIAKSGRVDVLVNNAMPLFTTMPSGGLTFVLSLLFIGCAVELRRGKGWARRFFAFIGVVCVYIFVRISFLLGEIAFHLLVIIPLMSMPVLLYLPVSSKWFLREHHCMISYGLWLLLFAVFAFIFYVFVENATLCHSALDM